MTILWINLLLVFIFSFLARHHSTTIPNTNVIETIKPNNFFSLLVMIPLVLIAGLRNNIGDTYFYKHAYNVNNFDWEAMGEQKNVGFWLFQKALKIFSDDPQILILTAALITNILVIIVFRKYSFFFELSTYVYITGGLYLVSMNGLRQVLTAAIIFTATKFLISGNWLKYTVVVLIASTFHESALILIPIYFFIRYKAWSKATLMLLFLAVLIVLGFNQFSQILFSSIENSQYGHYQNFNEGGASPLRTLVYGFPLLIAYLGKDKLREIYPESDFIVNMSLVGFVFMVISTQNWIFARFSIYFTLYQLILISWIVQLFRLKEQKVVYFGILVCYLVYYYYESVISLNIIYKSDYLL